MSSAEIGNAEQQREKGPRVDQKLDDVVNEVEKLRKKEYPQKFVDSLKDKNKSLHDNLIKIQDYKGNVAILSEAQKSLDEGLKQFEEQAKTERIGLDKLENDLMSLVRPDSHLSLEIKDSGRIDASVQIPGIQSFNLQLKKDSVSTLVSQWKVFDDGGHLFSFNGAGDNLEIALKTVQEISSNLKTAKSYNAIGEDPFILNNGEVAFKYRNAALNTDAVYPLGFNPVKNQDMVNFLNEKYSPSSISAPDVSAIRTPGTDAAVTTPEAVKKAPSFAERREAYLTSLSTNKDTTLKSFYTFKDQTLTIKFGNDKKAETYVQIQDLLTDPNENKQMILTKDHKEFKWDESKKPPSFYNGEKRLTIKNGDSITISDAAKDKLHDAEKAAEAIKDVLAKDYGLDKDKMQNGTLQTTNNIQTATYEYIYNNFAYILSFNLSTNIVSIKTRGSEKHIDNISKGNSVNSSLNIHQSVYES